MLRSKRRATPFGIGPSLGAHYPECRARRQAVSSAARAAKPDDKPRDAGP
jgi:hypothetical protein